MGYQHASAILAIIGLGFELGAIVSVARKFWHRRRDRTVEVPAAEARAVAGGNLRLGWNVEESHEAPRVPSIEELQARLDAIQQRIDVEVAAVHGEIDRTARKLREEMVDT